jgi:hypothetical protein
VKRALLLVLACALAACETPTIAERGATYDFAFPNPHLVFHWPAGATIRVFVDGGTDARAALLTTTAEQAMAAWNDVALFGEYELVRTTDIANADVLLHWSDVPLAVGTPDAVRCTPGPGRAVTSFCPDVSGAHLLVYPLLQGGDTGRVRFLINILGSETEPTRLLRLVTHELGHTLGLFNHPNLSEFPESVMLELPSVDAPSDVDRATIQVLYHTPVTLGL